MRRKAFKKEKHKMKSAYSIKLLNKADREAQKIDKEKSLDFLRSCIGGGQRFCIDVGFNADHTDREKRSLCRQMGQAYNAIKQASLPTSLHITSLSGDMLTLLRSQGIENWVASRYDQSFWDVFALDQIVLLSPDAADVLEDLQSDKIYVIGGIVDRSVRKSITLGCGIKRGVRTVRLPIQEFVPDRQSHVLNVDTTLAILVRYLQVRDWPSVLRETVPLRRQTAGGKAARREIRNSSNEMDEVVVMEPLEPLTSPEPVTAVICAVSPPV